MLTSRITIPIPTTAQPSEDIFSSSLSALFTDDTQNCHGSPGGSLTYASPAFGDLVLQIPQHPDVEEGRKLFAHYLWNSGIVVAEGVERRSLAAGDDGKEWWGSRWWDVRGMKVLELGAGTCNTGFGSVWLMACPALLGTGTALPSIVCALSGAASVTTTDHPSSPALTAGTMQANLAKNLPSRRPGSQVDVRGYVWGSGTTHSANTHGEVIGKLEKFDKIIVADCLWMPSQHENLVKTIGQALNQKSNSCAIIVAGFHTGRATVQNFFDIATGETYDDDLDGDRKADTETESELAVRKDLPKFKIQELFEVDVDGQRREWQRMRPGEGREETKRWCVVAILLVR